jgi:heme-degrading monooxygenase HmoA
VILQKYDGPNKVVVISLWRAGNPQAHHERSDQFVSVCQK